MKPILNTPNLEQDRAAMWWCAACGRKAETIRKRNDDGTITPGSMEHVSACCNAGLEDGHGGNHDDFSSEDILDRRKVTSPQNGRQGGRPLLSDERMVPYAAKITPAQRIWLEGHGGASKLREIIDREMGRG